MKKQWWRHDWEEMKVGFIDHDKRKCKDCGVEQQYAADTWYMRITGWSWGPKVPQRCPKAVKGEI